MTKQADLIAYLFEGHPHPLSAVLFQWMDVSPRCTAFVETYHDKIRKKIRVTRDPESILDLRAELEVAYCLLNDRRLTVAYEPYASEKRRGPDYAVTYRANLVFNVEVARLRAEESESDPPSGTGPTPVEGRILRVLLYKLGQMQPAMPNLLAIHTRGDLAQSIDLSHLMQTLKARVESKDSAFYAGPRVAGRYDSPAAFYKDFARLSGILLVASGPRYWANKQARPLLDEKIIRLVAMTL